MTLREPQEEDWPGILRVAVEALPWAADGNRAWLSNRREFQRSGRPGRHLVVDDGAGQILAYGAIEGDLQPWRFRIFLVMAPERLTGGLGTELYETLQRELRALSATAVWAREEQRDTMLTGFLRNAGFGEVERFTFDGTPMLVLQLELARSTVTDSEFA